MTRNNFEKKRQTHKLLIYFTLKSYRTRFIEGDRELIAVGPDAYLVDYTGNALPQTGQLRPVPVPVPPQRVMQQQHPHQQQQQIIGSGYASPHQQQFRMQSHALGGGAGIRPAMYGSPLMTSSSSAAAASPMMSMRPGVSPAMGSTGITSMGNSSTPVGTSLFVRPAMDYNFINPLIF